MCSSERSPIPDNWRKRGLYTACEEAGLMQTVEEGGKTVLKPKYSPYDLRHFYASMLIEQDDPEANPETDGTREDRDDAQRLWHDARSYVARS
jgi:hypothetical protein